MEFFRRARGRPAHLGILPGTFNPLTEAHVGLAEAALGLVDEVLFFLPRSFPHKSYDGAPFAERIAMLREGLGDKAEFSIASGQGGLFREIARECRSWYPAETRLSFLCGTDAAERIVNWNYGEPDAIHGMLHDFGLLVAARGGKYIAPPELAHAIGDLPIPSAYESISATEVRRRIAAGEDWEALVPPAVRARARRLYSATGRQPGST